MRRIRIYKKKKRKINIERLHLEELRVSRVKGNPIQAIPISANTGARDLESGV